MKSHTIRILLADDDALDRGLFREAFDELNMNTELEMVIDGDQLMEYLDANPDKLPHLLFLDLNMPKKNGMQCLQEIRAEVKYKDISIAIYSTSSSQRDMDESFLSGANVYIHKPADFEVLLQLLNKAVQSARNYEFLPLNKANFLLRL